MMRFRSGILLLAFALLVVAPAAADTFNGSFHYGKVRFEPVDGIAYQTDSEGEKTQVTVVALTSYKIERAAVHAAIDPTSSLLAQAGDNGNVVLLLPQGPDRWIVRAFLAADQQSIGLGSFPAKTSVASGARFAGDCRTQKPGKLGDDEYDFQFSVDLPITPIAKPAALPAGGGEPGDHYLRLLNAIQASDWDIAHLYVHEGGLPDSKKKASESNYFENLSANYPKSATVTGGLLKGDLAQIDIRGLNHDGRKIKGVVALKKVGSHWRVVDQQFFGTE